MVRYSLIKWILSFALFMFVYKTNNYLLMKRLGFDPSGHMLCSIVAYSNWLNLAKQCKSQEWKYAGVIETIATFLLAYQLYCIFFTAILFHCYSETLSGCLYGIFVSVIVFETDQFSDCIWKIINSRD